MPSVTVFGADNTVLSVSLDGTGNLQVAQQFFQAVINAAAADATLRAANLDSGTPVLPVPASDLGEGVVLHAGSSVALPTCYTVATDVAQGPATISAGAGAAPTSVLAGLGGLTFNAGPAQVFFLAGGGTNVFNGYVSPPGSSPPPPDPNGFLDNVIRTGDGNDTITTGTASTQVFAGLGANMITLGSGLNHVTSLGRDLILGGQDRPVPGVFDATNIELLGDGATVVGGSQPLYISANRDGGTVGGGNLLVTFGSGGGAISGGHDSTYNLAGKVAVLTDSNDTVNVGGATATVFGSNSTAYTGAVLVNGPTAGGSLQFQAGYGPATVAGADVAVTITGGLADDVTFTGAASGNMFAVFDGFQGNIARLDASASTGDNTFVTGIIPPKPYALPIQDPATVLGGTGADLFVIRTAPSSLTGGAGGANTYDFRASLTGGVTDVVSDFKATDRLAISGYAANGSAVLSGATVSGGSTTLTLSDQTRIVLQNFTALTATNFS